MSQGAHGASIGILPLILKLCVWKQGGW